MCFLNQSASPDIAVPSCAAVAENPPTGPNVKYSYLGGYPQGALGMPNTHTVPSSKLFHGIDPATNMVAPVVNPKIPILPPGPYPAPTQTIVQVLS